MRARVVDAGPLLFLSRLGRLDLLLLGMERVYVPGAVLAEIRQKPDPALSPIQTLLGFGGRRTGGNRPGSRTESDLRGDGRPGCAAGGPPSWFGTGRDRRAPPGGQEAWAHSFS